MGAELIFLVLIAVVLVFGFGVLLVSRTRMRRDDAAAARPSVELRERPTAVEEAESEAAVDVVDDVGVLERELEEDEGDEEAGGVVVEERPRFRDRLGKARAALTGALVGVRGRAGIDDDTWDELEEALLRADVGVGVTDDAARRPEGPGEEQGDHRAGPAPGALKPDMKDQLTGLDRELHLPAGPDGSPNVWLFVGVNGVGKTTTIGKVGAQQVADGRAVVMAAGDTFRAAAAEQLGTWAERAGADFVRGNEGGDPSAVIFDAVAAGRGPGRRPRARRHRRPPPHQDQPHGGAAQGPAGGRPRAGPGDRGAARHRRHDRPERPGAGPPVHARPPTSPAWCSPSSTARPRVASSSPSRRDLGIPVKLVGLGEAVGDLVPFDPDEFVDALFE